MTVRTHLGAPLGGLPLADVQSPQGFTIEGQLQDLLDIPVFHDDQHGTAIISGAGLINACEITGKRLDEIKGVLCGAGAAGPPSIELVKAMGVKKENTVIVDIHGVAYRGREV